MGKTTSLDGYERQINSTYLKINIPPTAEFFVTVKALYHIQENKLYKQRNFKSFESYLLEKWELKRGIGNRLCVAGRVISVLEKKFTDQELPSNATLCVAIEAWARKRNETVATVWKAALDHFEGRDNAVASHFSEIYEKPVTPMCKTIPNKPRNVKDPKGVDDETSDSSDSSSSSGSDSSETSASSDPSPNRNIRRQPTRQQTRQPSNSPDRSNKAAASPIMQKPVEDVFNTPEWLCDLIEQFTGGVDLDPYSNTSSKIKAKKKYGYITNNKFINGLTIADWEPNTNFVYMSPPESNEKHLPSKFWTKCFEEMRKGNVKRVIAFIPQLSYANWNMEIFSRSLVCLLKCRVAFEKADGTLHKGETYARNMCYLDTDDKYPYTGRFVETFGSYGYIPGFNMRMYKEPNEDRHLRYFSLCAGIGTAESAIHSVYRNAICVGYSEIDEKALIVYRKHFPDHTNFGDALKLDPDTLPDFDLLIGGIPCQPFSKQSINRTHFDDSRSKLFHRFVQILESKAPQHFLLENVAMEELPRNRISNELKVQPVSLNAEHWTAQKRKRLYWCNWYIPMPLAKPSPNLEDIIDMDERQYVANYTNLLTHPSQNKVCSISRNTKTGTLTERTDHKALTQVTGECYQSLVLVNGVQRHYSIVEVERLQGFPDGYTNCEGLTDTDKKRLLGNAMTLPVIEYIMKQL
ncbi:S-adenosyl-L-methionine-dependent methyltransferase [Powellomyces hirtus]|nr:S-adenosyl-L-methionine-dependent methyltransferase [Powellomyces hirtus]